MYWENRQWYRGEQDDDVVSDRSWKQREDRKDINPDKSELLN